MMALLPSYFNILLGFAPLPYPLMQALRQIEVETAVGRASMFRLHFDLSRNIFGDFDALALPIFRPLLPISIRASLGLGVPQAIINGYLQDARLSASNTPGHSTLELVGSDALGTLMGLIQQPFTWPNAPDSEIVRAIFGKYAVAPLFVTPTPPLRTILDTTTTQQTTDAKILLKLAKLYSFELYIQPDPVAGRDIGHFHPKLTAGSPQGVLSIDFGRQTNLEKFEMSNAMLRPTSILAVASDPHTRMPIPVPASISTDLPMGLEPALNRIMPPPIERPAGTLGAANPAEAQLRAMARATKTSNAIKAAGEINTLKFNRILMAGLPVLIRGAGRENSGLYYVESVTHHISRDAYTQTFKASRNAVGLTGAEVFIDPFAAAA
jgi:hypothetical protein